MQLSERTLCAYPSALHAQALGGLQGAQLRCGEQLLPCTPAPRASDLLLKGPTGSRPLRHPSPRMPLEVILPSFPNVLWGCGFVFIWCHLLG